MTRTDVHSPVNLVTEDYEYIDSFDNQPEPGAYFGSGGTWTLDDGTEIKGTNYRNAYDSWLRHLVGASKTARYGDCFQCDHCGARIRYVAVVRHNPTGDHIAVGETCLGNRFERATADFQQLRKQAQLDREQQRLLKAFNEFREAHTEVDWDVIDASENGFVIDVVRKLRTWGSISDKQLAAIQTAVVRDAEKAAAPVVPTVPVPTGKVVIEGKVVSLQWRENDYGSVHKALVIVTTPEGEYKIWTTVAKALEGQWGCLGCGSTGVVCNNGCDSQNYTAGYIGAVEVGDTIRFTATVDRSDRDESFGFAKRPTKASIVVKGDAQ